MAIRDIFKVSRKTFFNPIGWFNLNLFITYNQTAWDILKRIWMPLRPTRKETFEEATQRLHLTESNLERAAHYYYGFACVFFMLGIIVLFFGIILIFRYATIHGFLLSVAAAALFLVQAFKYHFWYFQIKSHKLGCTAKEWYQSWMK